jgi:capsular polysaccharide biosynthesis protein
MELKKIIKIFQKNILFLFSICILSTSLFYTISVIKKDEYTLKSQINISAIRNTPSNDFNYDNFYILETSRKLIQSCTIWLEDLSLISDILSSSGLKERDPEDYNIKAYQRSDTTFQIEWNAKNKKDLLKIGGNITEILQQRIEKTNSTEEIQYQIYSEGFEIEKADISDGLAALIGASTGIWIGIVWLVVKDYLKA